MIGRQLGKNRIGRTNRLYLGPDDYPGGKQAAKNQQASGGWYIERELMHLCFPPKAYVYRSGPGSIWKCGCLQEWVGEGLQIVASAGYPVGIARNDTLLGPLRWVPHGFQSTLATPVEIQEQADSLYDWRSVEDYQARLLRRVIEKLGGSWEDV